MKQWHLKEHVGLDGKAALGIFAEDGAILATLGSGYDGRDDNARLMVLAPEMVKALEDIADAFDRYDAAMTKLGRGHADYSGTRSKARELINRAKGLYDN